VVALFGLVFFLSFSALISLATPVRNANWFEGSERGMNQKVQQRK